MNLGFTHKLVSGEFSRFFKRKSRDFEAKVISLLDISLGLRLVYSTPYVLKGSMEDNVSSPKSVYGTLNVVGEEAVEKVEDSWSLRKGYEWGDYHIWEYFSKYWWSSVHLSPS